MIFSPGFSFVGAGEWDGGHHYQAAFTSSCWIDYKAPEINELLQESNDSLKDLRTKLEHEKANSF